MCLGIETGLSSFLYFKLRCIQQTSYDISTIIMMKYVTIYIYTNIYTYIDTEYSPIHTFLCDDGRE
jgi:hypothetical protein